jgi:hypothetical protein
VREGNCLALGRGGLWEAIAFNSSILGLVKSPSRREETGEALRNPKNLKRTAILMAASGIVFMAAWFGLLSSWAPLQQSAAGGGFGSGEMRCRSNMLV